MAEQETARDGLEPPQVRGGFAISPIWIFPLLALAIGGWLVFQNVSKRGPMITISFETADGIEEGKTKVKFREVEVGVVEDIRLKDDLSGVIATVEVKKEAEAFLTEEARFWVVRPRIGARGVSGLGTVVSGAFIEIDPGRSGAPVRAFTGLEVPPVITTDEPGKEFILVTEKLGSYTTGSPVYYRGLEVGEVLGHQLSENRREFEVHVFVHEPHDHLVRKDTRFWNVSGIDISLGADGLDIAVESLQALALGGIAFDTPSDLAAGTVMAGGETFRLHATEEEVEDSVFTQTFRWIAYFEDSVRGLTKDAPVEFKGIRVGRVVNVRLEFDEETGKHRIPVLLDIEPERVSVMGKKGVRRTIKRAEHLDAMRGLISGGLRARLKTGSLITGQLLVDLDFYTDEKAIIRGDGSVPEIPTIPSSIEEITRSLTAALDKIQSLPLDKLTESLTNTVRSVERLVGSKEIPNALKSVDRTLATLDRVIARFDADLAPAAENTLREANLTLKTIRETLGPESNLRYDAEATLQELSAAARSIRLLAEFLESNPNALIYGKGRRPPQ